MHQHTDLLAAEIATAAELLEHLGLTAQAVADAALRALETKGLGGPSV